jgi:L-rhamnose mutarotase
MSPAFPRIRAALFAAALVLAALISVAAEKGAGKPPQRYGSVIGLRAEKMAEYNKLHAAVWPEVAKAIRQAHIRNYSIFLRKLDNGSYYLFAYFEYVGDDFRGDMAKMAQNPNVKKWWTFTDPCQKPLADRAQGQWWASMEEVFHQD